MNISASRRQLYFGDKILVIGNSQISGMLSCLGFMDSRIFFQSLPKDLLDQALQQQYGIGKTVQGNPLRFVKNFNDLVFQVWPKLSSEAHKDLRRLIKERDQLKLKTSDDNQKQFTQIKRGQRTEDEEEKANKENLAKLKERLQNIEEKIKMMSERAKREREINLQALNRVKDQQVSYGQELQLMHFSSSQFLNGKDLASEAEKSAYHFELSDNFSNGMIFRFYPKFKLRQIGDPVQYNDSIIIQNEKLHSFINFNDQQPADIDSLDQNQDCIRYQSYLSLFSDVSWQIAPHGLMETENEIGFVKGGDLVRLRQTESGLCLTVDNCYASDWQETFLYEYYGEYKEERETLKSIWIIEMKSAFHRGLVCECNEKTFTMRHLLSGKVLNVKPVNVDGQTINTLVLSDDPSEESSVRFLPTVNQGNFLLYQASYNVIAANLFLGVAGDQLYLVDEYEKIENYYTQLDDKELQIKRHVVRLDGQRSDENAFWIEAISTEEKQLIGVIMSSLPLLKRFVGGLHEEQLDAMSGVLKLLTQLNNYMDEDQKKQKLFKNSSMLDILTQILYLPFEKGICSFGELKNSPSDLIKIFQQSYKLIKGIIREYRPNEIYMSQFIDLLMIQSMQEDPHYDIGAGEALTELIDNNKVVLESKIKPEIIKRFVEELLKNKQIKYLSLLKALINCNGQAMVHSQSAISELVLTQKNMKILIPETDFDGTLVKIKQTEFETDFTTFERQSNIIDSGVSFSYYNHLILFLSDLCLDKNFLAIQPLQRKFPFDMCQHILQNINYDLEVRIAYAQLIVTLWIDGMQLQKIQLPNFVRTWDDLLKKASILAQKCDTFSEVKTFIVAHLESEVSKGYQRAYAEQSNTFTCKVLLICKNLLEYGLYWTLDEIADLVRPLLSYLNGVNDIMTPEEERIKKRQIQPKDRRKSVRGLTMIMQFNKHQLNKQDRYSQSGILVQSRSLINEILLFIGQLVIDLRATLFLKEFRLEFDSGKMKESVDFQDQTDSPNMVSRKTPTSCTIFTDYIQIKANKIYAKLPQEDTNFFNMLRKRSQNPKVMYSMLQWLDQTTEQHNILSSNDINAVLIDLMMYKSPDLISTSFNLLHHNYSHKKALIDYLKDIQIIEDEHKMKILKEAVAIKKELQLMVDESENWWGQKKQEADIKSQKMVDYFTKLIKILFQSEQHLESQDLEIEQSGGNDLSQLMKEVDQMVSNPQRDQVDNFLELSSIDQEEIAKIIKPDFQKLMRNIQIHKPLLQLIEFDQGSTWSENTNRVRVLQVCYKFLAFYCFENSINKGLLMQFVDLFQNHLKTCKDSLSYLVLQEIFRNNRAILLDDQKLKKTLSGVCSIMKNLDFKDKLRIHLLESLQIYMRLDDQVIKQNQTAMLTHLGADPQRLLYILDDEQEMEDFLEECQQLAEKFDNYLSNYDLDQQIVDFMNDEVEYIPVI